jgi:hypothetical protein
MMKNTPAKKGRGDFFPAWKVYLHDRKCISRSVSWSYAPTWTIGLSFPKIPSGLDSHRKAESSHH